MISYKLIRLNTTNDYIEAEDKILAIEDILNRGAKAGWTFFTMVGWPQEGVLVLTKEVEE